MPSISIHIDDDAYTRLHAIAAETGRDLAELAECAVEEAALDYYRRRSDDPVSKAREAAG